MIVKDVKWLIMRFLVYLEKRKIVMYLAKWPNLPRFLYSSMVEHRKY